ISRRIDADACARRLSEIAEVVVAEALEMAVEDTRAQYGALPPAVVEAGEGGDGASGAPEPGSGIAIIAYGSFGGAELGFASDLDLVFVYDAERGNLQSLGARSVEGSRWYARVAQRTVHWLTTMTRSGRLYEVDVRLRPDGAKGLLVTSLDAFAEYQRERAWVWEHQALVRARAVAGDAELAARFAAVRVEVLARPRDAAALAVDVRAMRERWRAELDRSDPARFDLKQGAGGLVDLEFLLQYLVLAQSRRANALLGTTRTCGLIEAAAVAGVIDARQATELTAAHEALLGAALDRTLDATARVAERTDGLALQLAAVEAAIAALFAPSAPSRAEPS
ncbi:MAG TPA: glutamine-synthetase adenylyltransferase, partial [Candidatus Saccharimonadia bacterium]|nr:glutamine-synthetase adenylyltransferase [Candidatus Saccharimonadia bacterium]